MDVREAYERWPDKGPLSDGRRLTLLTLRTTLAPGDTLRVAHVYEVTEPGGDLYVMGPKPVYGEQLDGRPVTPAPPAGDEALKPLEYDGRVLPSPGIDHNFQTTTYTFTRPGEHALTWQIGELVSNTLAIEVQPESTDDRG
ncbi:MAG: hypothetical protein H0W96_02935 [Solirubrobacterales bacterium]|nr:hypothetical protein [Solirubrobacterales bacterium]